MNDVESKQEKSQPRNSSTRFLNKILIFPKESLHLTSAFTSAIDAKDGMHGYKRRSLHSTFQLQERDGEDHKKMQTQTLRVNNASGTRLHLVSAPM